MSLSSATDDRALSPLLTMDAVTLRVGDLENMSSYYANALGLDPLEERARGSEVHRVLGRGQVPLVRLLHTPDLPAVNPAEAGLFHTAFLFDDQASLAATLARAANDPRSRFVGAADHLVSEAFYFADPEGNGIELYWDRARELWEYDIDGRVKMDNRFLDPGAYLRTHLTDRASETVGELPGRVGHVHLQVGDVPTAREFYASTLGFMPTVTTFPGALFVATGGYHHHVAMNTWNSRGAGPRAARLGLGDLAITLPAREDLDALISRLRAADHQFADTGDSVVVNDPWGTQVTLSIPGRTAERLISN